MNYNFANDRIESSWPE